MLDFLMLIGLAAGFTYRTLLLLDMMDSLAALVIAFIIGLLVAAVTMGILRYAIQSIVRLGMLHTKSLSSLFVGFMPILYMLLTKHWSDIFFFILFPAMLIVVLLVRDRFEKLLKSE